MCSCHDVDVVRKGITFMTKSVTNDDSISVPLLKSCEAMEGSKSIQNPDMVEPWCREAYWNMSRYSEGDGWQKLDDDKEGSADTAVANNIWACYYNSGTSNQHYGKRGWYAQAWEPMTSSVNPCAVGHIDTDVIIMPLQWVYIIIVVLFMSKAEGGVWMNNHWTDIIHKKRLKETQ